MKILIIALLFVVGCERVVQDRETTLDNCKKICPVGVAKFESFGTRTFSCTCKL